MWSAHSPKKEGDSFPSKFVPMTYSRGEGDYLGRAGGGRAAFLTKFCFISGSFGAGGTSCQPAARRIVLFPLTFYFCFLFVFASACRAGGDGAGNGAGAGTRLEWHII